MPSLEQSSTALCYSIPSTVPRKAQGPSCSALFMSTEAAVSNNGSNDEIGLMEAPFKGIARDYRARLPLYGSDIKDGLNTQCLAAIAFLFFACLSPAVGFGALLNAVTGGAIGTIEMVGSTALCGMIYALTSAQPLTIIGSTGPVLAFVACLVQFANSLNLPFLPLYAWTGLWTSAILFVQAITSGSNFVKYLTRFTDEIFSTLISVIFVVEAVTDISKTFVSPTSTITKALMTLVCATTTFTMATMLKGFRNTKYFTKSIRNNISNFGPSLSVLAASLIARKARLVHGAMVALPSLNMPAKFATTSGRPWLVPLTDLPVWARWAAILPALMATVLLYLDQNITVRLVNNPQYQMKKGRRPGNMVDGMHADLLVISLLTALQSLVGMPWLVAATVRSISHVRALTVFGKDGEREGTIEQRVTGFGIHSLIGACILFAKPRSLMTQVPLPVLMGLFCYLGTSALPGNQMYERVKSIFQDKSAQDDAPWAKVPRKVVNTFTVIQVACLIAMLKVKESPIGVLFPIIIALLAPLRFGLVKWGIIKKEDMDVLDADE